MNNIKKFCHCLFKLNILSLLIFLWLFPLNIIFKSEYCKLKRVYFSYADGLSFQNISVQCKCFHFPNTMNKERLICRSGLEPTLSFRSCVLCITVILLVVCKSEANLPESWTPRGWINIKIYSFCYRYNFSSGRNAGFNFFCKLYSKNGMWIMRVNATTEPSVSLVQVFLQDLRSKTCENDRSSYINRPVLLQWNSAQSQH